LPDDPHEMPCPGKGGAGKMPSIKGAEFAGRKVTVGLVVRQPPVGNTKAPQTARSAPSVTKQIAGKLHPGGGDVKDRIPAHDPWPAVDQVKENEAPARTERGFEPCKGFGNVFEMMKGGMADDGVECFIEHEPVDIGQAVFHVGRGALAAGDGEHGFGDVDGGDGIEALGEFEGEQPGAAAHVQSMATALGQIPEKEIMVAFQRGGGVVRFREVIEGLGVV